MPFRALHGNSAIDLVDLLVEHGAEFKRDYYGCLPWEQNNTVWLYSKILGIRNLEEFEETYSYFRNNYS